MAVLIRQRCREIWFSEPWVGRQFIAEICELGYRTDDLKICSSFQLAHLILSPRDHGVRFAAHVRRLVVQINYNYQECEQSCCRPSPIPLRPPTLYHPYTMKELEDSLLPLQEIERKEGFRLVIVLSTFFVHARCMDVLDAIKPVIMQLKEDGMQISIRRNWGYTASNRYPDLMLYYDHDHSREEWREVCKQHRARLVCWFLHAPLSHVSPRCTLLTIAV
jgi:hypothetical protein